MAHIHDKIDFTVVAYIVYQNSVLMIFHLEYQEWLPPGGHVELDEDPETALLREIEEETGIQAKDLEIMGTKPDFEAEGTKFLYPPIYLDFHRISDTHKHIGMIYFAKSKTNKIKLAEQEHSDIRWFTQADLEDPKYKLYKPIKFYAEQALKTINSGF